MKSDIDLQKDVREAIRLAPALNSGEIGVTSKDGVVTLTGVVDSHQKKIVAEEAAKRVKGVKAIAEEIQVRNGEVGIRPDSEIASSIIAGLKWNMDIPNDNIMIEVENGWVTLSGEVKWNLQREAAGTIARSVLGVMGVSNNIIINSNADSLVEKIAVESALERNANIDDSKITVSADGHTITLSGSVFTLFELEEAAKVALSAPGVRFVKNDLIIDL